MLASLAWRNIWRQPVRSTLSLIGLAFTASLLVFALSFQLGSYDTMKTGSLGLYDGFGQFQPLGYHDDPDVSRLLPDWETLMQSTALEGIDFAAPRASSFAIFAHNDTSFGASVMGVDPALEPMVSTISATVREGRFLLPEDDATIVMGEGLARNLGLAVGDSVVMLGTGNDGAVAADVLEIVGFFSTGISAMDRLITQMPLARFQETFNMGDAVNIVALRSAEFDAVVGEDAALKAMAASAGAAYLRWDELQPDIKQAIDLDLYTAVMMYGVLVIVVVFILLNTLYMSVLERTREFGGLLAIGMRPRQIGAMVWLELIFLSLLGAGIGIALGLGIVVWVGNVGIYIAEMDEVMAQWGISGRLYPSVSLAGTLAGPGVIVASITVLGIIPYRRIMGLEPVSAMGAA